MAMDFDLKHAFYGGAGAAVGAIVGYLLGVVLYIVMLSSSAFTTNPSVGTAATNSGVFPALFALTFAALGFFAGFYKASQEPKTA